MKAKNVDKHVAKFVSILIENGFYDYRITRLDDHRIVNIKDLDATDFDSAIIYEDGTINFFIHNQFKLQSGTHISKSAIWKDIIQAV